MPFTPSQWHFSIDKYLNPWVPRPPWRHLPQPVSHFLGHRKHPQHSLGNLAMIFWAFLGVFTGIILIEVISHQVPLFREHGAPIIVGSFGAAAVLEFYAIESPLAQPRNAVLGQLFAAIIGVAISKLFELGTYSRELIWVGGSLSCACAVAVMALTNTVHPPAGATALLAVVDPNLPSVGWYLIPIVLLGCAIMQVVALLFNNIQRRFPTYWWTPEEVGQRWHWTKKSEAQPEKEPRKGSGQSDTDAESAAVARIVSVPPRQVEEGAASEEKTVVIKRGVVLLPDDIYITPEERLMLEELSERL